MANRCRPNASTLSAGKVWLVGAGPGDPDLLTLKALKAIEQADLILFDHLISSDIRALFPKQTPAFYVGKKKGRHSMSQDDLNSLLIRKAQDGLKVCRIKAGDPFVFGRGGEEMLALRQAGLEVEVVPGITAASGCTSYANMPLTHRGLSQGCTFITGHAETKLSVDWSALVATKTTLVFYMGLTHAAVIQAQLLNAGMPADMPAAVIEKGCCPDQRVISGSVSDLVNLIETHACESPSLIVVGRTVALADHLTSEKSALPSDIRVAIEQRLSA